MAVVLILLPFVLLGIGVIFVAFTGGPSAAREAYLSGGGGAFRVVIPLLYLALGIAVPAAVIASRGESEGGVGRLEQSGLSSREEHGKELFEHTCASCHNLDAVNARGVTGPDLDKIGNVTKQRVLSAIRVGGTRQRRMPSGLLQGDDAEDVALYVSKVAGQ
ncbi:MAG TPA: cytochrome c [Thermoleophilaceae bacterium]|nr:cytochrome c [Thermoleophilaceae bacterium]